MKSFNNFLVFYLVIASLLCTNIYAQKADTGKVDSSSPIFGSAFELSDVKTGPSAVEIFNNLEENESSELQLKAKVSSVCQVKGCWMVLDLEDGKETRVTFKDYGFFVPMDIAGREVVVNGVARVTEINEDEQKHYASDAGKTKEEINAIQGVKRSYSILADGVVLKD